MKKILLFLVLVGTTTLFSNCNKEEGEDLTIEIVGGYIGGYGSNSNADVNPYEVVVSRVDDNHIVIKPKSSTEFNAFEVEIERINISNISSPTDENQQLNQSVIFAIGETVAFTMLLDPTGEAHAFVGEKQ